MTKIRTLHDSPKAAGHDRIYVAGESEQDRLRNGIPLTQFVANELGEIGEEFGVPLPC